MLDHVKGLYWWIAILTLVVMLDGVVNVGRFQENLDLDLDQSKLISVLVEQDLAAQKDLICHTHERAEDAKAIIYECEEDICTNPQTEE